ncbi:23S rRNA (adenine(2503)-C(2))-methyltransferase RlmN [Flavobacteriaceae bacterium]|jgi:23S rRNA (adenine2503-C2)-methyltransferase|nr:23S rRNA (adenine(2503)-C(2))-methyltransferase RlmN [Flavobacteriaceae bacterium]MBT4312794.1 23S rRNA (adenine(2503)-C(2))-methyltransferase RlmN [Flavobacteriaceae bacterium]MBT5092092.1 23S rRNA (adenine(2503)-C(2))-methyltransferase RlmN [Flavobacteriaceae bacterium]MBT5282624.1 23S rRNA (adenine(2503)-C(2))-methyltransferase RlmN [Flavobacteriaceae bacterium]MBT5447214.1 23S rRNA (adenine(2503)-C(2))-methyltransferase RlmN [Flavobacteriaceae bacterium]|tara:strand:- start:8343 stop:9419 length:1077 start_codon:yes stop_codon:yes gene_type:complete
MRFFYRRILEERVKKDIRALSKEELQEFFVSQGAPSFKGGQVYQWLWQKGVHDFELMTNLSLTHRNLLDAHFEIKHINIDFQQRSTDGTIKNAVKLHDNLVVESVLIPTSTRTTACVSSQVGCSLDCTFCATAALKRMRNLNADEIYDQVVAMDQQSKLYHQRPLSNIVFMGMGEPLMNYNNVLAAIEKITDTEALGMSPRRITLSTSGIPKLIRKMADDKVKFGLAVSLHSARQEVRERIMPFAKKFPLTELIESLEYWYAYTKKQITFEYVVWEGVNDLKEDIQALVGLCRRIPSKVNIIQYNPIDGSSMKQGNQTVIDAYIAALTKARISVTYRRSRGVDIDAACGQLANKIDVK